MYGGHGCPHACLTLIGTGHLLFAGELGALPDASAVREIVEAITVGAEPGIRP
ncbi:hypothetical protein [Nonomuraea sp. SBT364]|uniref:hypothetical protein n=1 Tax=Nonomuraea sp. SBT364 TaxID=1580530 RepID=UPI000A49FE17|nr:hypothetical protein [Nonomuraea sp. SBT364]